MRSNRGFTLIELMVVIVIIGILAASAIAKFRVSSHRSKEKEADVALGHLYRLQQVHKNEHGTYATSLADLARVGYVAPTLRNYTWANSVEIPQCLESTGPWHSRGLEANGSIVDC